MPIEFLEQVKRQRFFLLIFLVILLVIVFVIWRGFFAKEGELPTEEASRPSTVKKIKINFQTLQNPLLEKLQFFEEIPPFGEKAGRENPFQSY